MNVLPTFSPLALADAPVPSGRLRPGDPAEVSCGVRSGIPASRLPIAMAAIETDELVLFARIAAGEADAFAEFYDRHASLFFGLACKILGDSHEAEDVVQEACVRLWERAPQYDSSLGRPLSWAITIVRHRAIDRLRARQRQIAAVRPAGESDELPEAPADLAAPTAMDLADTVTLIRQTMLSLPEAQQATLRMAFFEGLTHLEIAERLGVPLGTVKARIRRGLMALRDTLEGCL